ncbi:MAG: hypothetical protein JSW39_18340 [Desulfobacterales bacterium]|nr:MAG: hypothetical protein JSW39_18340 [Desulfobacterales bacterium]
MFKYTTLLNPIRKTIHWINTILCKIFNYLSGCDTETCTDRTLLRNLYNSGRIDEAKYLEFCEECSQGNLSPEKLDLPDEMPNTLPDV